jgi:hypothetical protein
MKSLVKRLKLKDQEEILVLNRPDDFANNLEHFEINVVESLFRLHCYLSHPNNNSLIKC